MIRVPVVSKLTGNLSLKWKSQTNLFKSCNILSAINKVTCSCYRKYLEETRRTSEKQIKKHQTDMSNNKDLGENNNINTTSKRLWIYGILESRSGWGRNNSERESLREKCPNTELFLVRIFPHSDWIRRDTKSQQPQKKSYILSGTYKL